MSQYLFTRPATERQFTVSPGRNYDTAQFSFSLSPPSGPVSATLASFFSTETSANATRSHPTVMRPNFFLERKIAVRCVAVRAGRVRVVGRARGDPRRARRRGKGPKKDAHVSRTRPPRSVHAYDPSFASKGRPGGVKLEKRCMPIRGDKCLQLSAIGIGRGGTRELEEGANVCTCTYVFRALLHDHCYLRRNLCKRGIFRLVSILY